MGIKRAFKEWLFVLGGIGWFATFGLFAFLLLLLEKWRFVLAVGAFTITLLFFNMCAEPA